MNKYYFKTHELVKKGKPESDRYFQFCEGWLNAKNERDAATYLKIFLNKKGYDTVRTKIASLNLAELRPPGVYSFKLVDDEYLD